MKAFVDPLEQFVINIPEEWYFTTSFKVSEQPYGFEPYEERNAAFRISFKKITEKTIKLNIERQPLGQSNLKFVISETDNVKTWLTNTENDYIVIISLVYENTLNPEQKRSYLDLADRAGQSFLLFTEDSKKTILPLIRWNNFMLSYTASIDLANRAYEKNSFVELVVILANQIDAVLRQSITLSNQLKNGSNFIDVGLIYQKEADKPTMEKTVYKKALDEGVIDSTVFDELTRLYKIRNKVVHRYIISDLRSNDVIELVGNYGKLYEKLSDDVIELEQRQFNEKAGIFNTDIRPGSNVNDEHIKSLIYRIRDKHGNRKVNEKISIKLREQVTKKHSS